MLARKAFEADINVRETERFFVQPEREKLYALRRGRDLLQAEFDRLVNQDIDRYRIPEP